MPRPLHPRPFYRRSPLILRANVEAPISPSSTRKGTIPLLVPATRALHSGQPRAFNLTTPTPIAMSNPPKADDKLSTLLTPSLPTRVYNFWFQHVQNDSSLTLPTSDLVRPWFTQNADFDLRCANTFKPLLTTLHKTHPQITPSKILTLINPQTPKDWLGLILLLDQLPRNCYRDGESALVFRFFDPLALGIALKAVEEAVPVAEEVRFRLALRFWFYLPFEHSEDRGVQEVGRGLYEGMAGDFRKVLSGDKGFGDVNERDREILERGREAVERILELNLKVQREHEDIIVRFGRYPHRNGALGRESTEEEKRFLQRWSGFSG